MTKSSGPVNELALEITSGVGEGVDDATVGGTGSGCDIDFAGVGVGVDLAGVSAGVDFAGDGADVS